MEHNVLLSILKQQKKIIILYPILYRQNLKIKIQVQIIDKNIHIYILQNKKIDYLHQ